MQKVTLNLSGLHCSSCSIRIDGDLEETKGVTRSETNFAKGQSTIEFDEAQISLDQIKSVIQQAGYTVLS